MPPAQAGTLGHRDPEQVSAALGQRVHDHLPVAPAADESCRAKDSQVVRNEVLGSLEHPREVADAELATVEYRRGQG